MLQHVVKGIWVAIQCCSMLLKGIGLQYNAAFKNKMYQNVARNSTFKSNQENANVVKSLKCVLQH